LPVAFLREGGACDNEQRQNEGENAHGVYGVSFSDSWNLRTSGEFSLPVAPL